MARPSLKEQRSKEILSAFARCVARLGLEGATLERIAEEAGVARPAVRHFIGNRDELVEALAAHVQQDYQAKMEAMFACLPETGRVEALLEMLFAPAHYSSSDDVALANALTAAAERYPSVADTLRNWLSEFDQRFQHELSKQYPDALPEDLAATSFGVISIYFNIDGLSPLALPDRFAVAAKSAALKLTETLETSHHEKR